MVKTPENSSSEKQPIPENKNLATIGGLLEKTLNFVENIIDNPGQTQEELKNQTLLTISEFEKFYRNNLKIFAKSGFKKEELLGKKQKFDRYSYLEEKAEGGLRWMNRAHYTTWDKNVTLEIERQKQKPRPIPTELKAVATGVWREVLSQKYRINMDKSKFTNFKFLENEYDGNNTKISMEKSLSVKIEVIYDNLVEKEPRNLKITLKYNNLSRHLTGTRKEKNLEISLC